MSGHPNLCYAVAHPFPYRPHPTPPTHQQCPAPFRTNSLQSLPPSHLSCLAHAVGPRLCLLVHLRVPVCRWVGRGGGKRRERDLCRGWGCRGAGANTVRISSCACRQASSQNALPPFAEPVCTTTDAAAACAVHGMPTHTCVVQDDGVGALQVETHAARPDAQQEHKHAAVCGTAGWGWAARVGWLRGLT